MVTGTFDVDPSPVRNSTMPRWLLAVAILPLSAAPLFGQNDRPDPTPAACQAMLGSLQASPLPLVSDSAWVWVSVCPGGGGALASVIGSLAGSTDSVMLDHVVRVARSFVDKAVFLAFRSLALNQSASSAARAAALYGLLVELRPGTLLRRPIAEVLPVGEPCNGFAIIGIPSITGTPLDPDAILLAAAVGRSIVNEDGVAPPLMAAARCLLQFVPLNYRVILRPSKIHLTYVCGMDFRLRNQQADPLQFTYSVDGSSESGLLLLRGPDDLTFTVDHVGTVRLYFNGTQVKTASNGGTVCP